MNICCVSEPICLYILNLEGYWLTFLVNRANSIFIWETYQSFDLLELEGRDSLYVTKALMINFSVNLTELWDVQIFAQTLFCVCLMWVGLI